MIKGILFDIDGTLVLSNDAHAHAWQQAFAAFRYDVPFEAIRRLIGMGGDKLLMNLEPYYHFDARDAEKIGQLRSEIFMKQYVETLHPAPGARDLLKAARDGGLKVIAASSAKRAELDALLKMAGVADLLTEATTSDEVEHSKPEPDIVQAALKQIGLQPDEVGMVGDTPYDIESAGRAGVRCVAVRTGGWPDNDLAAAIAIYNDPADILAHRADLGL